VARLDLQRHPLDDLQAVPLEPGSLRGVVGQQPQGRQSEVDEDLGPCAVVAEVRREAQLDVGLDRVAALLLQGVRHELPEDADPPALVPADVDQDALPLLGDAP